MSSSHVFSIEDRQYSLFSLQFLISLRIRPNSLPFALRQMQRVVVSALTLLHDIFSFFEENQSILYHRTFQYTGGL